MLKPLENLVAAALMEDVGQEDVTTNSVVDSELRCRARLYAKQAGVLSGMKPFRAAFDLMEADAADWSGLEDGTAFAKDDLIASFTGWTRAVLTAERTAMNFLQHLSGVATLTRRYVNAIAGTGAVILDTRKTTPGLRILEKYAVLCGGGQNHRLALWDMYLVKDNHIRAAGGVTAALERILRTRQGDLLLEVEVESPDQLREDRKSTRLNSSHSDRSRMPSSA